MPRDESDQNNNENILIDESESLCRYVYQDNLHSLAADEHEKVVWVDDEVVNLQLKQVKVLCALMSHPGQFLSHDDLNVLVGSGAQVIRNSIRILRKKLPETLASLIESGETGQSSYRFKGPVQSFVVSQTIQNNDGYSPGEFFSPAGSYLKEKHYYNHCLLYTSPSPRDQRGSRMPSSA